MRAPRTALPALLLLALGAGSCGGDDLRAADAPPPRGSEKPVEIPEGMEEWAHLLGHNTPYESLTDWNGQRPEGPVTLWHDNGVKQGEGRFDAFSRKVGPWTFWYENGQKRWEGTYEDGAVVGVEHSWYEDGTPHYEGEYAGGVREGQWKYWRPGGRPQWEGHFSAGKRHGSYRAWRADGTLDLAESGTYQHGVKIAELALPPDESAADG